MSTLTVYPNPGVTTDGNVENNGTSASFATIRGATGNYSDDTSIRQIVAYFTSTSTTDEYNNMGRGIFLFDTSALTASATISAVVMSIYGYTKTDTFTTPSTPDINIYTSTPTSNTALTGTDFSKLGTTAQCDTAITYANWTQDVYNDFTFNATGIGNVSKTGISKFGTRNANHDVANSAPTWSSVKTGALRGYYSDNTGTDADPKLVITYTVPPPVNKGAFFYFFY